MDTSVVIDLGAIDAAGLPDEIAISAMTLAELAAGPHATFARALEMHPGLPDIQQTIDSLRSTIREE